MRNQNEIEELDEHMSVIINSLMISKISRNSSCSRILFN